MHDVRLSARAVADLERLPDFLELASPQAAAAVREALATGLSSLAEFADRGHASTVPGYRELRVRHGRHGYVVRYRVKGHQVLVTRIFHARERRD